MEIHAYIKVPVIAARKLRFSSSRQAYLQAHANVLAKRRAIAVAAASTIHRRLVTLRAASRW